MEEEYKISVSPYAMKVFSQIADEILAYQAEHPYLTLKECVKYFCEGSEWVEI